MDKREFDSTYKIMGITQAIDIQLDRSPITTTILPSIISNDKPDTNNTKIKEEQKENDIGYFVIEILAFPIFSPMIRRNHTYNDNGGDDDLLN